MYCPRPVWRRSTRADNQDRRGEGAGEKIGVGDAGADRIAVGPAREMSNPEATLDDGPKALVRALGARLTTECHAQHDQVRANSDSEAGVIESRIARIVPGVSSRRPRHN